jgi:hypothetical protein
MTLQEASTERFNIGRVTSRMFDLIRRNFVTFFALAFLFSGVPTIISTVLGLYDDAAPGSSFLLALAMDMILLTFLQAALTRATLDDFGGKRVSLVPAIATALTLLFPLLGLALLTGLAIMLGLLALVVPGLYLLLRWMVTSAALVSERLTITGAMRRSTNLTAGHLWPIFGLTILYFVFVLVALYASAAVTNVFDETMTGLLIDGALNAFDAMVSTVGVASIYFELRQIKEGVSVSDIAAVFE